VEIPDDARVAPDGSPVDLYALLPDRGEGELVESALPPPATVLELGCGTGRVTRQLVARGYTVTAVDESPEMLAHVSDAETVCARIEGLELGRRFDLALLASNLLTVEPLQRRAFLETCVRHADLVVVEMHGEVSYRAGEASWSHAFAMRAFADEDELAAALADGGLRLERWLDRGRGWFVTTRFSGDWSAQAAESARADSAARENP
jgi:SAM-dependent methyltransferase